MELYNTTGNHKNISHGLSDPEAVVSYPFYADTNGYWYRGGNFNTFDIYIDHK